MPTDVMAEFGTDDSGRVMIDGLARHWPKVLKCGVTASDSDVVGETDVATDSHW